MMSPLPEPMNPAANGWIELLDRMMLANAGAPLVAPPLLATAPDAMEASSASPTNSTSTDVGSVKTPTSGKTSVVVPSTIVSTTSFPSFPSLPTSASGVHPPELAALIAAAQFRNQAILAQLQAARESEALSLPQPPLPLIANAAALFQFMQAQQNAAAAVAAQQRVAVVPPPAQAHERKRSYPMTFQWCELCQKEVHSSKLPCHIRQCHVAKPMFQCPACDFTSTYSKNNVKSHMVSLHGLAGDPISYMDQYAGQVEEFMKKCFPNVRGRGRPMHGRTSPNSPNSSATTAASRRTSQVSSSSRRASVHVSTADAVQAQANLMSAFQRRADPSPLLAMGLNPLMFGQQPPVTGALPIVMPSASSSHNNNNDGSGGTRSAKTSPPLKVDTVESSGGSDTTETVVVSSSSIDDILSTMNTGGGVTNRSSSTESIRSISSAVRPGENMQPRYLPNRVDCAVLNDDQLQNTVFARLGPAANLIEKLDLSLFEPAAAIPPLLSEAQIAAVSEVRRGLGLQTFPILYAIHRLDLTVLSADAVQSVLSIAPSPVDTARFQTFEQSNATNVLGEDEQFVLQLSKIERLEDKLHVMLFMVTFNEVLNNVKQSIAACVEASRALKSSSEWRSVLQLVLAIANLVSGDFNMNTIRGFVASQILDCCNHQLPSGQTLLSVMAHAILTQMPEMARVVDLIPILDHAANVRFGHVASTVCSIEEGFLRAEKELEIGGANASLADFIRTAQPQLSALIETLATAKEELQSQLSFMGEPIPRGTEPFQPEVFFAKIQQFLCALRNELHPTEGRSFIPPTTHCFN